jgi:hypothetical protein
LPWFTRCVTRPVTRPGGPMPRSAMAPTASAGRRGSVRPDASRGGNVRARPRSARRSGGVKRDAARMFGRSNRSDTR